MITFTTPKHHWNYFLAIEADLKKLSRYIEFSNSNLNTYSIELAHILLSSSSEIDVIMKQICALVDNSQKPQRITEYREIIKANLSELINEEVFIERFGLSYKPWENWNGNKNPKWWTSYNNVKHQRNNCFHEANLHNTIKSVGALLITVIYYYKLAFSNEAVELIDFPDTTSQLLPESSFLKMNSDYYYHEMITR